MSLGARQIALQGIGYGALFIALQGLTALEVFMPAPAPAAVGVGGVVMPSRPRDDDEDVLLMIVAAALQCGLLKR